MAIYTIKIMQHDSQYAEYVVKNARNVHKIIIYLIKHA